MIIKYQLAHSYLKVLGFFLFFLPVCFVLSIAEGRSTAGLMFFLFLFYLFISYRLCKEIYIYQFKMRLEPGGICILQSFKHCLTEEKTTINLAICANMTKSAFTDDRFYYICSVFGSGKSDLIYSFPFVFFLTFYCVCL